MDKARAAMEAIDVDTHVNRVESLKLGIAAKEKARDRAQVRLLELHETIRDGRQPDGNDIAQALLADGKLPPIPDDLAREKDQLVVGIGALNRQINDGYLPLRRPWDKLRQEMGQAGEPLLDDLYRQAQEAIAQVEQIYATVVSLSLIMQTGKIDALRRLSGTMLAGGREFRRFFEFATPIEVDQTILALNDLPALKAMRRQIRETVDPPSQLQMDRDGL
ncbi:hypothetical protein [Sphingobium fuliginis]|uniref:hypothetical protein n=1 Tax=Sphingobium fuliginis (strain ATCC 27551) TaxID=336203 RepID=UPI0010215A1D|nr:hypothetical protein [Sphingobium fuliginis]RYL99491.1 hypothetical protein EWH10_06350 [Sphingobium fuliginis]